MVTDGLRSTTLCTEGAYFVEACSELLLVLETEDKTDEAEDEVAFSAFHAFKLSS